MKRLTQTSIGVLAMLAIGLGMSRPANADVQEHLHLLAAKIESQANELLLETHHYRHAAHYREMLAQVNRLRMAARHVRTTTFFSSSLRHLEADARILDSAFHEVEDFFDHVEVDALHGRGHIHGNTRHVKRLLNRMEDNIHHLQDDVDALRRQWRGARVHRSTTYVYPSGINGIYSSNRIIYSSPIDDCDLYRGSRGGRGHGNIHRSHGRNNFDLNRGGLSIQKGGLSFRIKL